MTLAAETTMMMRRSLGLTLFLIGLAMPATAQQTGSTAEQNALRMVEAFNVKYIEAYNNKDAAGVASLYTEDGVLVPPGAIAVGRQDIEKAWRAVFDAGRTGLRYMIREAHAEGNLVWAVGQFTVMSPEQGGVMQERRGNFANLYQREGGDLKFRVHAFNFLPAPPALTGSSAAPAGNVSGDAK